MEKRVLGIILAILGMAALIMAAVNFINGGQGSRSVKAIFSFALLGIIFFFAGVSLIRTTSDKR